MPYSGGPLGTTMSLSNTLQVRPCNLSFHPCGDSPLSDDVCGFRKNMKKCLATAELAAPWSKSLVGWFAPHGSRRWNSWPFSVKNPRFFTLENRNIMGQRRTEYFRHVSFQGLFSLAVRKSTVEFRIVACLQLIMSYSMDRL